MHGVGRCGCSHKGLTSLAGNKDLALWKHSEPKYRIQTLSTTGCIMWLRKQRSKSETADTGKSACWFWHTCAPQDLLPPHFSSEVRALKHLKLLQMWWECLVSMRFMFSWPFQSCFSILYAINKTSLREIEDACMLWRNIEWWWSAEMPKVSFRRWNN